MMIQNARINSPKLKPLLVLEQISEWIISCINELMVDKRNTGIVSSTYACFNHLKDLQTSSHSNDDNINRSSSNYPLLLN